MIENVNVAFVLPPVSYLRIKVCDNISLKLGFKLPPHHFYVADVITNLYLTVLEKGK